MTTNSTIGNSAAMNSGAPSTGIARALPWVILAVWFIWLAALVAMSYPEWGKSKRELIEKPEPRVRRVLMPGQ